MNAGGSQRPGATPGLQASGALIPTWCTQCPHFKLYTEIGYIRNIFGKELIGLCNVGLEFSWKFNVSTRRFKEKVYNIFRVLFWLPHTDYTAWSARMESSLLFLPGGK